MYNSLDMFVIEKEISKNVSDKGKRFEAMCKLIRTTKEYQECANLYKIYVIEAANFLHQMGINDPEIAVIYLDLMLKNGLFSITGQNTYHLFKNDNEHPCELFGARTLSGTSVCRHMSALTADILNIEHYAGWLNVKNISSIEEINDNSPFLHAVVGVVCSGGKIIYDPTASSFAGLPKDMTYTEKSQARVVETFISFSEYALPGDLMLLNNQQYIINPENFQELEEVWYAPIKEVNLSEFKERIKETKELYQDTGIEAQSFKRNIEDIAKRIVELESIIQPHSDEKILKWELHN